MPELKEGLERLAGLTAPPDDAFDRLSRKRGRTQRNRRIGAALLAFAVAGAGVGAALVALGRSGIKPLPALRIRNGYGIQFPDGPLGYERKGLAVIDAATNLPDGTKVNLYLFGADVESPGQAVVKDGRIPIRIWNGFCHETEAGLEGTTTKVTAVVSPVSGFVPAGGGRAGGGQYTPPPWQPPSVQAVLGPHFERLTGDQVVNQDGRRMLVASKLVQLPADTCQKKYGFTKDGSYELLPMDQPVTLPTGPFPKLPFRSCPDPEGALPVEAGDWNITGDVAQSFDAALTTGDTDTLRRLADPSVSFDGWTSTGSTHSSWVGNVPFGDPAVATGCGALVFLRTVGAQLARSEGGNTELTYLLILRPDGWKVWGELPGDGQ